MAAGARPVPGGSFRAAGLDPLRLVWGILTNVKVALVLIGLSVVGGTIGVILPQVPAPMRANPAARAAWIELRREDFGSFSGLMDRLDLFDVFYSPWFNGLWLLIILSVTVSTVSRFRPTFRSVQRPVKEVPDRYFEVAHHRADFSHTGGPEGVMAALTKRRYTVQRSREDEGATYLFAQRYAWGAYGTFLSHLALLIFLVGALLTRFAGFDTTLALAERTPGAPVFAKPGPNQLFVRMLDAVKGTDASGNIVDFRSQIQVTKAARTVTCVATVNDPCHAFGYKFHQAAFFDDIARLRVLSPDGRVVYDDIVDFDNNATAVPAVEVTSGDGGAAVFSQPLPQMATDPGRSPTRDDDVALARFNVPGTGDVFVVTWRVVDGVLRVALSGVGIDATELRAGQPVTAGPYRVRYLGPAKIPALTVSDMPGAGSAGATVQMPVDGEGKPYLFISGVGDESIVVRPGEPATASSGFSYGFDGRLEASGINIKRDPGDTFIWLAVGMAIVGLGITFYVPRRRLWVKVTPSRTYFAGVAERTTRFGRELRAMGTELGSSDAIPVEDIDERY